VIQRPLRRDATRVSIALTHLARRPHFLSDLLLTWVLGSFSAPRQWLWVLGDSRSADHVPSLPQKRRPLSSTT